METDGFAQHIMGEQGIQLPSRYAPLPDFDTWMSWYEPTPRPKLFQVPVHPLLYQKPRPYGYYSSNHFPYWMLPIVLQPFFVALVKLILYLIFGK